MCKEIMVFVLGDIIDHLCDVFRWAGGEVGRGESESTVCPSIIRLEVNGHFLFPLPALTKVQAVHTDEPVRAGDHFHQQGQLWVRKWRENTVSSD